MGEWSHWSGCAEQCQPDLRIRRRYVQQEPKNGGEPCPALEEKAGCLEYLTYQGEDCGHEHGILFLIYLYIVPIRAFINFTDVNEQKKKHLSAASWLKIQFKTLPSTVILLFIQFLYYFSYSGFS